MKHNEHLVAIKSNPLMEQVYTILDSRIQYIEYQAQTQLPFQCKGTSPQPFALSNQSSCMDNLVQNFDEMLAYLKELNQSLKLLQVLKSWLKDDNAQQIFQLLSNKKYLNYTAESLEMYLRKKQFS